MEGEKEWRREGEERGSVVLACWLAGWMTYNLLGRIGRGERESILIAIVELFLGRTVRHSSVVECRGVNRTSIVLKRYLIIVPMSGYSFMHHNG